jgi:hypothetical protein
MPLTLLLPVLQRLCPDQPLLGGDGLEHLEDARHHALKATEVDVCALLHSLEDLIGVLLDLVLDVHLAALLVVLLARQRVVQTEVLRELRLDLLPVLVIQKGVGVGHTEEQPSQALEVPACRRVFHEEAADEGAVRGDAGAGSHHDDVGSRLGLGHQHDLASGAGQHHLVAGLGVAQEVAAHTLLGRVVATHLGVKVGGAAHAQSGGGSLYHMHDEFQDLQQSDVMSAGKYLHVISVTSGRDGV